MSRSELEALYVPLRQITRLPPLHVEAARAPDQPVSVFPLILLAILGCAVMLLHAAYYDWMIIDDSFITYRYAENLARHGVLEYNLGEKMEGFSNLLWTLQLAGGIRLGLPLVAFSKALGILANLGLLLWGLVLVRWMARRLETGPAVEFCAGLLCVAWLAGSPVLAANGQSGLETTQHAFWVALAFGGAVLAGQSGRFRWRALACLGMSAVVLSRPEGFGYLPLWGLAWIGQQPGWKIAWRRNLPWLLMPVAVFTLLVLWRLWIYGAPLPLTVGAKVDFGMGSSQLERGLQYALLSFTFHSPLWLYCFLIPSLVLLLLPGFGLPGAALRAAVGLLLPGVANLVFVTLVGGDFMGHSRLATPAVWPVALLLAVAVLRFGQLMRAEQGGIRTAARLQCLLVLGLGLLLAGRQARSFIHNMDMISLQTSAVDKTTIVKTTLRNLWAHQIINCSPYYNLYTSGMAPLALEQISDGQTVVLGDIGILGFTLPEVKILDLNGLVTEPFARFLRQRNDPEKNRRNRAEIFKLLSERRPEWLWLDQREQPLLTTGIFAPEWPDFSKEYVLAARLEEYGGEMNLDVIKRINVYRRLDVLPAPVEQVTRHYQRQAEIFPHAADARQLLADWQRSVANFQPFVVESIDAQNHMANRIRLANGARLEGAQFLGRFDTIGSLDGWTMYGLAFRQQPRLDPIFGQQPPSDYVGRGYINSYHSAEREAATGWAESPPFVPLAGDSLLCWMAGGVEPTIGVELWSDGKLLHHWNGYGHDRLTPRWIDLSPWAGRNLTVRLIDQSTTGWLLADHFVIMRKMP